MTGHEQVIALRRSGLAPGCIWVDDYQHSYADSGTVCLSPYDVPEQQDWRFVVGLPVLVSSRHPERLRRIAEAVGEYASRVICNHLTTDQHRRDWHGLPLVSVIEITDTKQEFTWQG